MSGLWRDPEPLVLASASAIRARILTDAGLPVAVRPSQIDERAVEAALTGDDRAPAGVAVALGRAKAIDVSLRAPGVLVIGADQTLSLDGERFSKPADMTAAREQLVRLSGRTHVLASAAAIARDGALLWSGVDEARLAMRELSPEFLDAYLDAAGEGVLSSVGGYRYEGLGAHLFERVDGDFRTVLGLPLTPALAALRALGALAS